jgi:hypothetical protein
MPLLLQLRGREFHLTNAQITRDAPNLFSTLLQDAADVTHGQPLQLERSPEIFELIYDHLCGYPVLPLDGPIAGMSP